MTTQHQWGTNLTFRGLLELISASNIFIFMTFTMATDTQANVTTVERDRSW